MIAYLTALQLVLPVALLAWLAFAPPRSAAGLIAQASSTALLLIALALAGMWLFPPWWTVFVLAGLWFPATWFGWRRHARPDTTRQDHPRVDRRSVSRVRIWAARTRLAGFVVLAMFATHVAGRSFAGRTPDHEVAIIDVADPLRGGPYLVTSGGSSVLVNSHNRTLDGTTPRMAAHRGQSYAVDLIRIDRFGLRAAGVAPTDPAAYRIFGDTVFAPCAGTVRAAVDGFPDLPVPQADSIHLAGNHVLIECGDAVIVLAHLSAGSVAVAAGEAVTTGDPIGRVGNSGNTGEPHLHIHAQHAADSAAPPLSGTPLQIRIGGRHLVRNDRVMLMAPGA